jgi:hypothetical protein
MSTPRLVMLHVTAIDHGTHYVVINRKGMKSSILRDSDTGEFSARRKERITSRVQWRAAFQRMLNTQNKRCDVSAMSEWERKCRTWQASLNLRAKHDRMPRQNKRYFTQESRPNWDRAAQCMLWSYYNRVLRKRRHDVDPWARWAETTSKNHNRKERCRVSGN